MINHVGLIPDGTRRWARKNNVSIHNAYLKMVHSITSLIDYLFSVSVDFVSVYLLSKDNLQRNQFELQEIYNAELYFLSELVPPIAKKHEFDVSLVGNLGLLPDEISLRFRELESPRLYSRKLFLLVAYSPFDELADRVIRESSENPDEIVSKLWVPKPLDIVIRTGGEQRLSQFLPLQSSYAELFFIPEYINDIKTSQVKNIVEKFNQRRRRFGQ